jgi:cyclopropane fatty-acyl-phospholipid synthase-like methyltransferase
LEDLKNSYKPELYEKIKDNGYNFAKIIIPELQKIFPIKSVLDVGCGGGSFLHGCFDEGLSVFGVDGEHVKSSLQIGQECLMVVNLEEPLNLKRQFDLCASMEVAEHLDFRFSDTFIDTMCCHSNNILFGAAQPLQPGIHHVNCQTLEFWQKKFSDRGYTHISSVSEWIRSNRNIYHWYRKNSMLFRKVK